MARSFLVAAALIVFFAIGFISGVRNASAFELSFVGAANFSNPSISVGGVTASGYNAKPAFGGGALVGFDLLPFFELEFGALYVGRHYKYPVTSGEAEDSLHDYEIPVVFRFTGLKFITAGAGVYYAIPAGQDTYTVTPTGSSGTTLDRTASSNFKNDFGVVGSVGLKIPFNLSVSFLIDGRYYYGVTDASKIDGQATKFRDAQALFGLNFGF